MPFIFQKKDKKYETKCGFPAQIHKIHGFQWFLWFSRSKSVVFIEMRSFHADFEKENYFLSLDPQSRMKLIVSFTSFKPELAWKPTENREIHGFWLKICRFLWGSRSKSTVFKICHFGKIRGFYKSWNHEVWASDQVRSFKRKAN